ncbi:MAG: hypothetical protein JXL97_20400 [Bacteroidales bacterium]|nr:hypothetical protein [Bacteroidales bacterium]
MKSFLVIILASILISFSKEISERNTFTNESYIIQVELFEKSEDSLGNILAIPSDGVLLGFKENIRVKPSQIAITDLTGKAEFILNQVDPSIDFFTITAYKEGFKEQEVRVIAGDLREVGFQKVQIFLEKDDGL